MSCLHLHPFLVFLTAEFLRNKQCLADVVVPDGWFSVAYLGHIHGLRSENHSAAALVRFPLSLFTFSGCYPAVANITHGAFRFDVHHIIHLLIILVML